MFNSELAEATVRLDTAIRFRQMGGGYWYPDTTTDRNAVKLAGVKTFKPTKTEDEMLTQLSGLAFCEFLTPPLGRKQEAAALLASFQERKAAYDAAGPLNDRDAKRLALVETAIEELTEYPTAEAIDAAAHILEMLA